MNREQCERATALFAALEQHDRHIAGMLSPRSVDVIVKYGAPNDGEPTVLNFALPVSPQLEGDAGIRAYGALLQIMRDRRAGITTELRQLGAVVPA
ncbi:MAG TPA: hypothetical protein DEQ40_00440 [Oxalobacteraceae bacterium]|nr:hypothetical protein [Oxalobacteraceae bacterium]